MIYIFLIEIIFNLKLQFLQNLKNIVQQMTTVILLFN